MRRAIDLLTFGAVHEWFTEGRAPPIGVLVHAAAGVYHRQRAIAAHERDGARHGAGAPSAGIAFIGRPVWPTIFTLHAYGLLRVAMLIDPRDDVDRLWAIDLALRSPAVRVVVADGSGLDIAATRRLQLATRPAESAPDDPGGTLALLARPARERRELSAAATRWLVEPGRAESPQPSWRIRPLRIKGQVGAGIVEQTITAPVEEDLASRHFPAV